jgi:hypothetical protein
MFILILSSWIRNSRFMKFVHKGPSMDRILNELNPSHPIPLKFISVSSPLLLYAKVFHVLFSLEVFRKVICIQFLILPLSPFRWASSPTHFNHLCLVTLIILAEAVRNSLHPTVTSCAFNPKFYSHHCVPKHPQLFCFS